MKKILLATVLVLAMAASVYAVPQRTAELGVPARDFSPAQDVCYIGYYNFCSGWVWYWTFNATSSLAYGSCFDLATCATECRSLTDIYWGCKRFTVYGMINVEVFGANAACCPVGPALAGVYNWPVPFAGAWKHFVFDPPICLTGWDRFVVKITDPGLSAHVAPYSDNWPTNMTDGCATQWKCVGHSYIYDVDGDFCALYGQPQEFFVGGSTYGCVHPLYGPGVYADLLIDTYISCLGPTATEKDSWSAIKSLYK